MCGAKMPADNHPAVGVDHEAEEHKVLPGAQIWAERHASERNPRSRHCQALLHRLAHELALAGWKLKAVSTDNGSEFVSGEFRAPVESHGASQRRIKAGRPTSNGCVERVVKVG